MTDAKADIYRRSFNSTYDELETVLHEALAVIAKWSPRSNLFTAELILRESLVNALKHGNGGDPHKHVELVLRVENHDLYAQISDEGTGFNWQNLLKKNFPPSEQEHGRGLLLLREYGCNPCWNERGNCLSLKVPLEADPASKGS